MFLMALTCLLVLTTFPLPPIMHLCRSLLGDLSYIHSLAVMWSFLSLPPQSSCGGLNEGDNVVIPLDGGHSDQLGQVLGVVAGGGEDDPLLSGDVLVYISPTPVVSRWPR